MAHYQGDRLQYNYDSNSNPHNAPPSYNDSVGGRLDDEHSDTTTGSQHNISAWKGIASFDDVTVRQGFIRKVYCILFMQLSVSIAFICLFLYVEGIKTYVQGNKAMFWTAWVLTLALIIAMACFEDARRRTPTNYILLSLFTLCESYLLGVIASYYDADTVLMAVGITAGVALALTLFAFQTKYDFTGWGVYLFAMLICLLIFGFISVFVRDRVVSVVYAALGALLFSFYLIYDTQIMLGGSHKYSLSPEEYIFAALNLYLDIVNLFLFILSLLGRR